MHLAGDRSQCEVPLPAIATESNRETFGVHPREFLGDPAFE
jgi:hypothetical protein